MIIVDKLCYCSGLRYVNATEKFSFTMLTLLICVLSRSITIAVIVLFVTGILTVKKGKVPFSRYVKLMSIPIVFLLLSTLAVMINISKIPLDAFAFPIGPYYITGSIKGIFKGLQLISTAFASVSCLYFLSLSTPVTDILDVMRNLRIPNLFLELMLLIYRYIFIMLHLASAITTSQHSRLGNKDIRTARASFGQMLSSVFILSLKRSNALYNAMEARCYDGTIHVLPEHHPAKTMEITGIILFELFLGITAVIIQTWR